MRYLMQVVANLSEGRNPAALDSFVRAVEGGPGALVTDLSADQDHHRCVITFLGEPDALQQASLRLARSAVEAIDLRQHRGEHPRTGALDLLPFVPWGDTPLAACREAAFAAGTEIAAELSLPVFFYAACALRPDRAELPELRRRLARSSGEDALQGDLAPDAGPSTCHPTAGATIVGARPPLIAYNVVLDTDDPAPARAIAAGIREANGGLPGVRALAVQLHSRRRVQVSMNLTQPDRTGIEAVYGWVQREARRYGVGVLESEIVGGVRLRHLLGSLREAAGLKRLRESQVLDPWACRLGAAFPPAMEEGVSLEGREDG